MKKNICSCLLVLMFLVISVPVNAKEWYEGGNLHSATVTQWKRASYANKLATCGDWLANFWLKQKLNLKVDDMDDLRLYANALVEYVDKAINNTNELDREAVNTVALFGMLAAGWVDPNSNFNSDSTQSSSQPVAPLKSAENADKKLQANGFLLDEEIEEIWQNETTPDVLEQLTEAQQKAINEELKKAQDIAAKSSLEFGKSIDDPLEQSYYQEGVRKNKILKATREIAKKYGIKVGDIFTISNHLFLSK